jgi:heat shock protein HslJ
MRKTGDSTRIDIGRWHRAVDGTRLTLIGHGEPIALAWSTPDTIRADTSGSARLASTIALPLVRTSSPAAETATLRLTGRYLYYADAGRFRPCRTGIDMRVAQEEANARLERAYLEAGTAPQSRVRVTVDGRFEQRPRIDSPGREDVLVVDRVVRVDPEGRCEREDASLTGTTWRLVQLGDRLLSFDAPEATLRLTASDSTVAGTGGCNRFGGRYRLDDPARVSFSGIAATKRLCEEATMQVEEGLLRALHEANRFRVVHQSLELFRGDTRLARLRQEGEE